MTASALPAALLNYMKTQNEMKSATQKAVALITGSVVTVQ